MNILAKPIEVVSHTTANGEINPLRFRLRVEDESYIVIKVDRVLFKQSERLAGIEAFIYRCQTTFKNEQKLYELKYFIKDCKWILWKM